MDIESQSTQGQAGGTAPNKGLADRLEEQNRKDAAENLEVRRRQSAEIMGKRYRGCTFETFELASSNLEAGAVRSRQTAAVAAAKSYAANIVEAAKQGTNLVFFGTVGAGKDHLMAAVAKHEPQIPWPRGYCSRRLIHQVGAELFTELRAAINTARMSDDQVLRPLQECGILLFSDPTPPGGGTLTEFQRSALYQIVDDRYRANRPIICTINASSTEDLDAQLTPEIADRLLDGAMVIECNWPSYRRPREVVGQSDDRWGGSA